VDVDVVALACLVGLKASGLTWSASGSRALAALMVSFGCRRARSFRVAVVVARHGIETWSGRSSEGEISVAAVSASVAGHGRVTTQEELSWGLRAELVSMDRAWLCGSQWTA
jgi:hypothetical protein